MTSLDPGARRIWRDVRGPALVAAVVLLGATVLALVAGGEPSGRLDPRAPDPAGSRAVAEVLRDQGVAVELATTTRRVRETAGQGSTVLVVDPELLVDSQVSAVRATGADLVVVEPARPDRFAPSVTPGRGTPPGVRQPGCDLGAARRAGAADAGGSSWTVDPATTVPTVGEPLLCYARDGLPSLVQVADGARTVTVLGNGSPLTNSRFDDEGNAALVLGLLGGHDRLVWYLPSLADVPPSAADRTFYDLVPDGVWWGLVQLGVAVLLLALWRARRLGPVVAEPLPVVVRAAEAVEGRARLYRRGGARDTAAEALRDAVRSRLAALLGLPPRAEPTAVVDAVSARSRRTESSRGMVGGLLYGAAPADDAALVRLADDLDALEREVRRP